MPVKNAGSFLEQCLDSILHQDFGSWELIAVDDHSTDTSMGVLEKFEKKDKRIHFYDNPGDGIISALKHAFDQAKGEFISRMDADDMMPVNKLSTLYKALNRRKKVVVTGKVRYFSDRGVSEGYRRYESWINEVVEKQQFIPNLYRECIVASPNWLVHRECFEKHFDLDDLIYPEDYDMVFKWVAHDYRIEGVPRTTHLWREHPARTSRKSEHYQQHSFFKLKTLRFIQHFRDEIDGVQVIGKSDKGKMVVDILRDYNIKYEWFDLKPTKGRHKSVLELEEKLSILSNWPVDERVRNDIREFLRKKNLHFGEKVWLF